MLLETARAKINWALRITGVREDGYHTLDTILQSISVSDELAAQTAPDLSLAIDGTPGNDLPTNDTNLVLRAARALNERMGTARGAEIRLTKRIPTQAGLGGGSADCAGALKLLRKLWEMPLTDEDLWDIARKLGADVPFCLRGGLCRARGIGEILTDIRPIGEPVPLVIVKPERGVSTPEAFRLWDAGERPQKPIDIELSLKALEKRDWRAMRECAGNALEPAAALLVPEIARIKRTLLRLGSPFAAMTGSGSAVFGVFETKEAAERAASQIGIHASIAYAQ